MEVATNKGLVSYGIIWHSPRVSTGIHSFNWISSKKCFKIEDLKDARDNMDMELVFKLILSDCFRQWIPYAFVEVYVLDNLTRTTKGFNFCWWNQIQDPCKGWNSVDGIKSTIHISKQMYKLSSLDNCTGFDTDTLFFSNSCCTGQSNGLVQYNMNEFCWFLSQLCQLMFYNISASTLFKYPKRYALWRGPSVINEDF